MALMSMMGVVCFLLQCSSWSAPHNQSKQVGSIKHSLPVLCVHFMQAFVGEVVPPVAVEELAVPGDGAPSVAVANAAPDNIAASVVQV